MDDTPKTTLADGSPVTDDHRTINSATGQQQGYVVLSEEERKKGFVRPYRNTYIHVGVRPQNPTRPLTEEEKERHGSQYVLFEEYPASESPVLGKFWTKLELESGCGTETVMGRSIAETYARDPKFYGGTFCCGCRGHFPLDQFIWKDTDERVGS